MKFMCLGSDVGGINRKPVKLIFTLELGIGNVIGRRTIDLRICSCPKRDKQQEEARYNVRLYYSSFIMLKRSKGCSNTLERRS
jgi:hypothetical protein